MNGPLTGLEAPIRNPWHKTTLADEWRPCRHANRKNHHDRRRPPSVDGDPAARRVDAANVGFVVVVRTVRSQAWQQQPVTGPDAIRR